MRRLDTKAFLEQKYSITDPWDFQKNVSDRIRRAQIIRSIFDVNPPGYIAHRALDVGAGEGWITQQLPALLLHAIEISDNAASRFPPFIERVGIPPPGKYDLILASGVFYSHYDWESLHEIVFNHAKALVVTCHIKADEIRLPGKETLTREFPYRGKTQILRHYDFN